MRYKNAAHKKALKDHEDWLKSRGLHISQLREKRKKLPKEKREYPQPIKDDLPSTSDKVGNGFVNSIMNDRFKESPEVQAEILRKASRVAPAFSKGAAQYITDGADLTEIGKKK